MNTIRSYALSAANMVSGATDMLLNNRLGQLTLNSMEFTVTTVHQYVDQCIPPIQANETFTESKQAYYKLGISKFS